MSTTIDDLHPGNVEKREDKETYGPVARALHWLVFVLMAAQVTIGWSMPHIRRGTPQEGLVDWHLSLGAVLILVVIVRLLWRLKHPTPLTTTMAPWERKIAKITHQLLYALLLILPVLGWAAAGYFGYTVRLFGIIPLPALADRTMEWAHEAGDIHAALTWVLLGLVALHVLGALWHYFVRHDRVLQRMLPGV
jgi:cytochrome b561